MPLFNFLKTKNKAGANAIDTKKKPFVPSGLSISKHNKNGIFVLDFEKIKGYEPDYRVQVEKDWDEKMRSAMSDIMTRGITGFDVMEELKGKKLLNSNVLDYLLEHQGLIPEDWKLNDEGTIRHIYFFGTIFKNQGVGSYVCYLYWNTDHWDRGWKSLANTLDTGEVVVIERKVYA